MNRRLISYPNLRVAYIDEARGRDGATTFYSVLIKASQYEDGGDDGSGIEKVYKVRLPGNPVLGEGKPENQNHAMIFTRGEYVQAIDMNQDGFFEEALKHRNLLEGMGYSLGCGVVWCGVVWCGVVVCCMGGNIETCLKVWLYGLG